MWRILRKKSRRRAKNRNLCDKKSLLRAKTMKKNAGAKKKTKKTILWIHGCNWQRAKRLHGQKREGKKQLLSINDKKNSNRLRSTQI